MNIDLSGAASIHPTANVDGASALGEHSYVGPWCDVVNSTCGRFTFLYGDIRLAEARVAGFALSLIHISFSSALRSRWM